MNLLETKIVIENRYGLDVAANFAKYAEAAHGLNWRNLREETAGECVMCAFNWDETEEGHKYWEKIAIEI